MQQDIRQNTLIENQYFMYTNEKKGKKTTVRIEMCRKPRETQKVDYLQKVDNYQNEDERSVQPPLHKYVIREKMLHHRHFLKYDAVNNQLQEYCKESLDSTCQKENDNEKYLRKYDTKYPQYYIETEEDYVEEKQPFRKYVIKPKQLFKPLDEYFIENERSQTMKKQCATKAQRDTKKEMKSQDSKTRAEIIKNFQQLYQNQSKLIEAQNFYIHEQTKLLQARQLVHMGNVNKTLWMENHAQIFENKCYGLAKEQEKLMGDLMKLDGNTQFQQYVTTL